MEKLTHFKEYISVYWTNICSSVFQKAEQILEEK